MRQIISIVFLLIMTSCQQQFQMRTIYYSQIENVCFPRIGERVPTTFFFDQQTLTQNLWVGIECSTYGMSFFYGIDTSGQFTTEIQKQQIDFGMEMKKKIHITEKQITTNITLTTKKIFYKGFDYQCELIGDGKMQHYNAFQSPITSTLKIECQKIYGSPIQMI